MTEGKQRIAICSAIPNWRVGDTTGMSALCYWVHSDGTNMLSDPLNDLNAMHEAEKVLEKDEELWRYYRSSLEEELTYHHALRATAAQRAKAFLGALGKWEE